MIKVKVTDLHVILKEFIIRVGMPNMKSLSFTVSNVIANKTDTHKELIPPKFPYKK